MKTLIIFFITILFFLSCSVSKKEPSVDYNFYTGRILDSHKKFNGLVHQQSKALIESDGNYKKEYDVAVFKKRKNRVVFFEEIIREPDNVNYKILDYLVISGLKKDDFIVMECLLENEPDSEIFCIVKCSKSDWMKKKYFENIKKAYRANRQKEEIEEIAIDNLKCINDSYGI